MNAVRSDDLRSQNRSRVLEVLRQQRIVSRTDISAATRLSPATVSTITANLLEEGVVRQTEPEGATIAARGRPQVSLTLNPDFAIVGAVYFKFNRVAVIITDYAGNSIAEHALDIATQNLSADDMKQTLSDCIDLALQPSSYTRQNLCRLTVGAQGVIDARGTAIIWSPMTSQREIPVQRWLESEFGVPTRVSNDCDLIATALHQRDPDKLGENFGTVLLDHGVGMGLYIQNSIINGTHSSGIEFGHMTYMPNGDLCRCGSRGCIEAYAGDYAISRRANPQSGETNLAEIIFASDLEKISTAAKQGDVDAIAAIESAGAAIGTGLASLFALVDSFPVVLVGSGTIFFEQMEKSIRQSIDNSPTFNNEQPIEFDCFQEVGQLVLEGGMLTALQHHDQQIANNRLTTGVVS